MMVQFKRRIHIEAPVKQVFEYVSDFQTLYAELLPGVRFTDVTKTPEGVGTAFSFTTAEHGLKWRARNVWTEFVPYRRIVERQSGFIDGTFTYTFESVGRITLLTIRGDLEHAQARSIPLLGRALEWLVLTGEGRELGSVLTLLKARIEGTQKPMCVPLRCKVHVNASVEEVFTFASDLANWEKLYPGLTFTRRTQTPEGEGSRLEFTVSEHGFHVSGAIEWLEFVPNKRILQKETGFCEGIYAYTVEPEAGGTRLAVDGEYYRAHVPLIPVVGKLVEWLVLKGEGRETRYGLKVMKAAIEGTPPKGPRIVRKVRD